MKPALGAKLLVRKCYLIIFGVYDISQKIVIEQVGVDFK